MREHCCGLCGRDIVYAIVRTGGKQYKVAPNSVFSVEKLASPAGEECVLDDVLLVADDDGVRIGTPRVPGASVKAVVVEQYRGKKIRGLTYKAKKNVRRRYGHRQFLTRLKVVEITSGNN